jgi:hypothetical protein
MGRWLQCPVNRARALGHSEQQFQTGQRELC